MGPLLFFPQLVDVPRFACGVPCERAQETMFFGDSGFDIGACVFGADFGFDDSVDCSDT